MTWRDNSFYKVAQVVNNPGGQPIWGSCATGGELLVQYKLGEWVRPAVAGTPLFLFSNLEYANELARALKATVWCCEVLNPKPVPQVLWTHPELVPVADWPKLWREDPEAWVGMDLLTGKLAVLGEFFNLSNLMNVSWGVALPGTFGAQAVKLVEPAR